MPIRAYWSLKKKTRRLITFVLIASVGESGPIWNFPLPAPRPHARDTAKYLGVAIKKDLGWNTHNNIYARASKTLGFLRRNSKIGSTSIKQTAQVLRNARPRARLNGMGPIPNTPLKNWGYTTKSCQICPWALPQHLYRQGHARGTAVGLPSTTPPYR